MISPSFQDGIIRRSGAAIDRLTEALKVAVKEGEIRGVRLQYSWREEDPAGDVVVLVDIGGEWVEVIREIRYGPCDVVWQVGEGK